LFDDVMSEYDAQYGRADLQLAMKSFSPVKKFFFYCGCRVVGGYLVYKI